MTTAVFASQEPPAVDEIIKPLRGLMLDWPSNYGLETLDHREDRHDRISIGLPSRAGNRKELFPGICLENDDAFDCGLKCTTKDVERPLGNLSRDTALAHHAPAFARSMVTACHGSVIRSRM